MTSLADWCQRHLGAAPARRLFSTGHLAEVIGLELDDGRSVVVKVRPASERLAAVVEVQRQLFASGFPCPQPLAGPARFDTGVATAESYLPAQPPGLSPPPAVPTARLFAELIDRAPPAHRFPTLRAPLPWVGWDHGGGATWPEPDDLDVDLNADATASALDAVADRVRLRLRGDDSPEVVGHADWEAHNLGWLELEPVAVYDWDSLAVRTEPTLAGAAATVFACTSGERVAATVEQTDAFLTAFQSVRGKCTREQLQTAWAAGLWVLLFNAKKETVGGGSGYLRHLSGELDDRMRRAGL